MQHLFYGLSALLLSFLAGSALAQNAPPNIIIPESSIVRPEDAGLRAHTNTQILNDPNAVVPDLYGANPQLPPGAGFYETPASLACIYGLVPKTLGCNPQKVTKNVTGGSKVVAIVDAFDDPTALSDLATYSKQFGLPAVNNSNFQVVYASGTKPPFDPGWQQEEALDTQMVHALAPKAKIILVEAASNSFADLLQAEKVAANLVASAGGGEISNSWGSMEFAAERTPAFKTPFTKAKVVFFASTGDAETPSYPAVLPNVVAVGGTSVLRDSAGNFLSESSWTEAGAGPSVFVPRPAFQSTVQTIVGTQRGVADISADADPNTGVWVHVAGQWLIFGGTSVSCPILAAITNAAKHFLPSTTAELNRVYHRLGSNVFNDIKQGTCSAGQSSQAMAGYDFCTGVGSPKGLHGL